MEKLKKLNDYQLAFIVGLIIYVCNNLFVEYTEAVTWYVWATANAVSAVLSILLAFGFIKLVKWGTKHIK